MRADWALAERRREVRLAARAWRRAGAIDEPTLGTIEAAYPDDRARLGPVLRTAAFVFGLLALFACFGVIGLTTRGERSFGLACVVFALLLVIATEVLLGPLRRADTGLESATALTAFVAAVVAFGTLSHDAFSSERSFVSVLLAVAVLVSALGGARWGSWLLAVLACVCGLLLLARLPGGRLLWLLVAGLGAPLLLRASESPAFAPSHRRSFRLGLLLALVAFYLAVHLASWDHGWIEWVVELRDSRVSRPASLRPLSILATALVPLVALGFGVVTRRVLLVDLGIVLGAASLVTLRFYVQVAPLWLVLVAAGSAALLAALGVRRLLATGAGRERGGFSAEPLFEDAGRRATAEIVGALATLAPDAAPTQDRPLERGGGRFGGGGATSEF